MNIQSIQTNQLLQSMKPAVDKQVAGNNQAESGTPGANAGVPAVKAPDAQLQSMISNVNYFQEQIEMILTSFPPFSPPGHPARTFLVNRVRNAQEEMNKASGPSGSPQQAADAKLSVKATDAEIEAALHTVTSELKNRIAQIAPAGKESVQPGTVLNLKV